MSSRILEKLNTALAEQNFYEAHQIYRTLYNRHAKQAKWNDAKLLLKDGVKKLLPAVESAYDLFLLLLNCYKEPSEEDISEIIDLLLVFPSCKHRTELYGHLLKLCDDPAVYDVLGKIANDEGDKARAEGFLLNGTAMDNLVQLLDSEHALFCTIIKLLAKKRPLAADKCFELYLKSDIISKEVVDKEEYAVYSNPHLNAAQYFLLSCSRQNIQLFRKVKSRYQDEELAETISHVENIYFQTAKPVSMVDMLSQLMNPPASQGRITDLD